MTTQVTETTNGLDTTRMFETIEALKSDPSLAKFEFRARNSWINGGENCSTIQGFCGAGGEDASRAEPFVLTTDTPPVLLGDNAGANPPEHLLHALAACVTTTLVFHAAARGIRIEELSAEVSGDMDMQGMLALDDSVPVGYEQIRITLHVKADCSDEELEDLIATAERRSPVYNTVSKPVPVILERAAR